MLRIAALAITAVLVASQALGQLTPQMQAVFPRAQYISPYSRQARAHAAMIALNLPAPPRFGRSISLTPDAPFSPAGAHLSFWKTSFVLGTPAGGEAGVNFWNIHTDGHINVGFAAKAAERSLLDCRVLVAGLVLFKVYTGSSGRPTVRRERQLRDGHLFVLIPPSHEAAPVSVELWPATAGAEMGLLGCDIDALRLTRRGA